MMLTQRRLLQTAVAIGGLIPVGAGLSGAALGPAMVEPLVAGASSDSHFRYLSGLLLAIGIGFWSTIPAIEAKTARFRLLTAIVFAGGLARAVSLFAVGLPDGPMIGALAMELAVTPLLCLWQSRVATQM